MNWVKAALCAQTDPEVFFPNVGEPIAVVKALCGRCPVRAECLEDAVSTGDVHHGVRGGLAPAERRALMLERGERACYDCRVLLPKGATELRCDECRVARREQVLRRYERSEEYSD